MTSNCFAVRRPVSSVKPLLAGLVVSVFVLIAIRLPDHPDALGLDAFLRLPLEWPLLCLMLLLVPGRMGRVVRAIVAVVVFLLLALKIADLGTQTAFQRPFNPYLDSRLMGDGWNVLSGSIGAGTAFILGCVVLFGVALVIWLFWRSAREMAATESRARRLLIGAFAVLAAFAGASLAMGLPRTDAGVVRYLVARIDLVIRSAVDMQAFEKVLDGGVEPLSGDGLFGRVRGRDIVVIFVESYGRSAIEDPRYAPLIQSRLAAVEKAIGDAGLFSASTWVTSPTVGGLSWLAHGTLMSGLWIDNQARYDRLMMSRQPSLNRLFSEAGWQSVAIMPAITMAWPEAAYYGYDRVLAAADLGYRGKPFNWITMPDQYTLAAFERLARQPARAAGKNVMAEIALISSHAPWTPVARLIDWDAIGDGTVFDAQATSGDPPSVVWADPERVRRQYIETIDYSLQTLGSYMARFGSDTVFVILGDHQPASIVTGPNASRAVPVHVISGDADFIRGFEAEGFAAGMTPRLDGVERPMKDIRPLLIKRFTRD
ncbi:sulfatase-like hydrolase/transferase [Rhizobium sp. G187]|uniref:sulfatase-like hydrolase/transferase n=1 Tax=Rhizobium sp. G187 TaxID=3451352 RepID=UPI003EE5663E